MAVICIRGTECSGCMECQEESEFCCPVCGEDLESDEKIYLSNVGDVVGCAHCIETRDAEDVFARWR